LLTVADISILAKLPVLCVQLQALGQQAGLHPGGPHQAMVLPLQLHPSRKQAKWYLLGATAWQLSKQQQKNRR